MLDVGLPGRELVPAQVAAGPEVVHQPRLVPEEPVALAVVVVGLADAATPDQGHLQSGKTFKTSNRLWHNEWKVIR